MKNLNSLSDKKKKKKKQERDVVNVIIISFMQVPVTAPAVQEPRLPWQERSSVSSLKPFLQLHSKLPMVFLQEWSQPPLLTSHSSISAGETSEILRTHFHVQVC